LWLSSRSRYPHRAEGLSYGAGRRKARNSNFPNRFAKKGY
jgi:hypothetical protein